LGIALIAHIRRPESNASAQKGHSRGGIRVVDLLQVVPGANNASSAHSVRAEKVAPANIAILPLSNAQRDKVVHHTSAKDPIARSAQARETKTSSDLRPHRRVLADKVRNTGVVQEVQASDARESLGDDVREDAAPALCIHGLELGGDVPDLHDAVDPDEDVGGFEGFAVPEEHPGADADVADGVVGDELDDFVELFLLRGVVGAVLPQLVEPCELEAFDGVSGCGVI
jgi:hypothetical protein